MNKKNIKILIIVISCILLTVFLYVGGDPSQSPLSRGEVQKEPKALSGGIASSNIKSSLVIQDKKYEEELEEGSTVFDLMNKIQNENIGDDSFNFKYKEYTGLGIFINEINGLKGGGDGYWIYSVNGKEATVGVSNYKINNGDIISWKYEK